MSSKAHRARRFLPSRSASTAKIIAACLHSKSSARATAIGRAARSICCPATGSRSGWTCKSEKPGSRFRWIEQAQLARLEHAALVEAIVQAERDRLHVGGVGHAAE